MGAESKQARNRTKVPTPRGRRWRRRLTSHALPWLRSAIDVDNTAVPSSLTNARSTRHAGSSTKAASGSGSLKTGASSTPERAEMQRAKYCEQGSMLFKDGLKEKTLERLAAEASADGRRPPRLCSGDGARWPCRWPTPSSSKLPVFAQSPATPNGYTCPNPALDFKVAADGCAPTAHPASFPSLP
jgi:hypothetical protein